MARRSKKINHEGMICGHAGFIVIVKSFILFADLELRLAIGLSGLQGPAREKEKREKERSELRDLVITCNPNFSRTANQNNCVSIRLQKPTLLSFSCLSGREELACSQSD